MCFVHWAFRAEKNKTFLCRNADARGETVLNILRVRRIAQPNDVWAVVLHAWSDFGAHEYACRSRLRERGLPCGRWVVVSLTEVLFGEAKLLWLIDKASFQVGYGEASNRA